MHHEINEDQNNQIRDLLIRATAEEHVEATFELAKVLDQNFRDTISKPDKSVIDRLWEEWNELMTPPLNSVSLSEEIVTMTWFQEMKEFPLQPMQTMSQPNTC